MNQAAHNKIVAFIWGIADDVLRDLFRRGKYPDVILPMCVIRRMDAVLEPTKQAVLDAKQMLDSAGIAELSPEDIQRITNSWRVETAPPLIAKVHKPGKIKADPMYGLYDATIDRKPAVVEYEPDPDLRDSEQVPLLEPGGIEAFIRREVLPYTPDAWVKRDATKIGYEISFTRHFYKPQPLRTLAEIRADILAIENEAEGLLDGLLKGPQS